MVPPLFYRPAGCPAGGITGCGPGCGLHHGQYAGTVVCINYNCVLAGRGCPEMRILQALTPGIRKYSFPAVSSVYRISVTRFTANHLPATYTIFPGSSTDDKQWTGTLITPAKTISRIYIGSSYLGDHQRDPKRYQ